MSVILTKVSDHGKTSQGSSTALGGRINVTNKGHSMWTLVSGTGSERTSRTLHCSEKDAEHQKSLLKA